MAFDVLRVAEHLHGHLGWLAVAALLHPAILLRDEKRRAHLSVALATGFATLEAAIGACIYAPYRALLRPHIFHEARWVGLLFERKEHWATGVVLLVWAATTAYGLALGSGEEVRVPLRTFAHHAFAIAAAFALATACLGTAVACFRTF
jgi:hypothetical protein